MRTDRTRRTARLLGVALALAVAPGATAQEKLHAPPYDSAFTYEQCDPQLSGAGFPAASCGPTTTFAERGGRIEGDAYLTSGEGGSARSHARHYYGGVIAEGLRVPGGARQVEVVVEGVLHRGAMDWWTVGWSSGTIYATACAFRSEQQCAVPGAHTDSVALASPALVPPMGSFSAPETPFSLRTSVENPRGRLTIWAGVKSDLRLGTCVAAGVCDGAAGYLDGKFSAVVQRIRVIAS